MINAKKSQTKPFHHSITSIFLVFSHSCTLQTQMIWFGRGSERLPYFHQCNERADNIRTSKPIRKHITLYSTLLIQNSQRWGPLTTFVAIFFLSNLNFLTFFLIFFSKKFSIYKLVFNILCFCLIQFKTNNHVSIFWQKSVTKSCFFSLLTKLNS